MEIEVVAGERVLKESWKKAGGIFTEWACTFFGCSLETLEGRTTPAAMPLSVSGGCHSTISLSDGRWASERHRKWMSMNHTYSGVHGLCSGRRLYG